MTERTIQLRPDALLLHFKGHVLEYTPPAGSTHLDVRRAASNLGEALGQLAGRGFIARTTRERLESHGFTITAPERSQ